MYSKLMVRLNWKAALTALWAVVTGFTIEPPTTFVKIEPRTTLSSARLSAVLSKLEVADSLSVSTETLSRQRRKSSSVSGGSDSTTLNLPTATSTQPYIMKATKDVPTTISSQAKRIIDYNYVPLEFHEISLRHDKPTKVNLIAKTAAIRQTNYVAFTSTAVSYQVAMTAKRVVEEEANSNSSATTNAVSSAINKFIGSMPSTRSATLKRKSMKNAEQSTNFLTTENLLQSSVLDCISNCEQDKAPTLKSWTTKGQSPWRRERRLSSNASSSSSNSSSTSTTSESPISEIKALSTSTGRSSSSSSNGQKQQEAIIKTGDQWPVKHSAVVEGDLVLGGLMMVHEREDSVVCGPVMPQGGIQALEAMLYTLNWLNERDIVPGVKVGAHILDDCDKDTYGLEMAVDFIKGKFELFSSLSLAFLLLTPKPGHHRTTRLTIKFTLRVSNYSRALSK